MTKGMGQGGDLWPKDEGMDLDGVHRENFDTEGDPLEDWRANKEGSRVGKSFDTGEVNQYEDDEFINKNDKDRNYWVEIEEVGGHASMHDFFEGIPEDTADELIEEFEREQLEISLPKTEEEVEIENEKNEKNEKLLYGVEEFTLMQECAKYNDFLKNLSDRKAEGPVTANGERITNEKGDPITPAELSAELERYKKYKAREGQWYKIGKAGLDRMYKCVMWDAYFNVLAKRKEVPKRSDGTPLSSEDIAEIADEYHRFRKENPEGFAEQKYQKGEWKKEYFTWNQSEYKGKKQWVSPIQETYKKDGQQRERRVEYITNKQPYDNYGEYYFIQHRSHTTPDGNVVYRYIELKYPLPNSNQKNLSQKVA